MERQPTMLFDSTEVIIGRHGFEPIHDIPQCRGTPMWVPCFLRAATQGRPYGIRIPNDHDNAVEMIRHHDVFVGFDRWKLTVQFRPPSRDHSPGVIGFHFSIRYFSEQTYSILCAEAHEIGPDL